MNAKLARYLLEIGLGADEIVGALEAVEAGQAQATPVVDAALERKRAYDREYARKRRAECRPEDWAALRQEVFERDGYRCVYCGEATEAPHCDHVVPLAKGGVSVLENLATACAPCNISKKDQSPWGGRQ